MNITQRLFNKKNKAVSGRCLAHNLKARGSIPLPARNLFYYLPYLSWQRAQQRLSAMLCCADILDLLELLASYELKDQLNAEQRKLLRSEYTRIAGEFFEITMECIS